MLVATPEVGRPITRLQPQYKLPLLGTEIFVTPC